MVLKCKRRGIQGLMAMVTARQRLEGAGGRGDERVVGRISRSVIQATRSVSVCMFVCVHTHVHMCTYIHKTYRPCYVISFLKSEAIFLSYTSQCLEQQ